LGLSCLELDATLILVVMDVADAVMVRIGMTSAVLLNVDAMLLFGAMRHVAGERRGWGDCMCVCVPWEDLEASTTPLF
jgi:hypothetical protein